jgi:hypothetical protein
MGLEGALNITEKMETLSQSLALNKVPGTWEFVAYPSKKLLEAWFLDLCDRCE